MSRTVSMGIFSYDRSEEPPSLRFFYVKKQEFVNLIGK
jgi:hypothetical protein